QLRPLTETPLNASPLNASPLTGSMLNESLSTESPLNESPFSGAPSYQREVQPDLEPLSAPSLHAAKPAYSDQPDSSTTVDDAYRQGYEAGRTATEKEAQEQPPAQSRYQLNPPDNSRPSTGDSGQRTQLQIEQDARDLQGLSAGLPITQGSSRFVNDASD